MKFRRFLCWYHLKCIYSSYDTLWRHGDTWVVSQNYDYEWFKNASTMDIRVLGEGQISTEAAVERYIHCSSFFVGDS